MTATDPNTDADPAPSAADAAIAQVERQGTDERARDLRRKADRLRRVVVALATVNVVAVMALALSGVMLDRWYRTEIVVANSSPPMTLLAAENRVLLSNAHWIATIVLVLTAIGLLVAFDRFARAYVQAPISGKKRALPLSLGVTLAVLLAFAAVGLTATGIGLPARPDYRHDVEQINRDLYQLSRLNRSERLQEMDRREFFDQTEQRFDVTTPEHLQGGSKMLAYGAHALVIPAVYGALILVLLIVIGLARGALAADTPGTNKKNGRARPKHQ